MLFDSSAMEPGKRTTIQEYISRMGDRKEIYYICAPSRALALESPYLEALKESKAEVNVRWEGEREENEGKKNLMMRRIEVKREKRSYNAVHQNGIG